MHVGQYIRRTLNVDLYQGGSLSKDRTERTLVAVEPVTEFITSAFRLIVLASSVVRPLTVTVPLTLSTSPACKPSLIVRAVMLSALLTLLTLTVSVPATEVVSTISEEP